jgi:RNA polymerase sigma-B factor
MAHAASLPTRDRDARLLAAYAAERQPRQLEELVERYQPLSRSLATRYRSGREPFDDLVQVADLGLVKAIQGFDPERGKPFTAYAVPTILGELRRHFRDRVWNLRPPRQLQESIMAVEAAADRLTERQGRSPTVEELADESELTTDNVDEALVAREVRWTASLDAPARVDDQGAETTGDRVGTTEPGYDRVEADLACSSAGLDERERKVIELRFEAGMTQAEIGDRIGVSQMQVSRLSRRGLKKLLASVRGRETMAVR